MRHIIRTLIPAHSFLALIVTTSLGCQVSSSLVIPAEQAGVRTEGGRVEGGWNLWSDGLVGQRVKISRTGLYTVVIRAWGSPAGGTWPEMALLVDGLEVKFVSVDRNRPADYRFALDLEEGSHEVAAGFLNDARVGSEDRNLYLERITIVAPPGSAAPVALVGKEDAEDAARRERESLRPPVRPSTGTASPTRLSVLSIPPASRSKGPGSLSTRPGMSSCSVATSTASIKRGPRPRMPSTNGGSRSSSTTPPSASTGDGMRPSAAGPSMQTPTRLSHGAPSTASG